MRADLGRSVRWVIGLAALLAICPMTRAADWPQWRGPQRNGASSEKGLFAAWPPKTVWKASVGIGYSSVVVAGGRAFALGHTPEGTGRGKDHVYCFDAASGKLLWKHSYDCLSSRKDRTREYSGPRSTPLVDGDRVYTVSLEGHLFCLDVETGEVHWQKDLKKYSLGELTYGFCSSPVIHDNILMCHVAGACMAFNKISGKPLWRCRGGGNSWNGNSPVIANVNGSAIVLFGEKSIVGARVDTGKKLWEHPLQRISIATPVVSGASVFFSTYPNRGTCGVLDFGNGRPKSVWSNRRLQVYHVGTPVLWDGYLYGFDANRTEYSYEDKKVSTLRCIDFKTGKVKWTQKRVGWGQIVAADGKLLVQRLEGELILAAASPAGFTELGRAQVLEGTCWAVPALAGGRIYCRNNEGEIVCLSATAK